MFRLGGNVRQNYSNGTTFEDIEKLINKVRDEVKSKTGVSLDLEIKIIGDEK